MPRTDPPWEFTTEGLDDIEHVLVPLVGEEEARLLRPSLHQAHDAVVTKVSQLPWLTDPLGASDEATSILIEGVDVSDDTGDVPWAIALVKLVHDPQEASRFARRWWTHMARAHVGDVERSAQVFVVAAYAVAASERLLQAGTEAEVIAWVQRAMWHTHFEKGLGLVLLVRAARLFQPLLDAARAVRLVTFDGAEDDPP